MRLAPAATIKAIKRRAINKDCQSGRASNRARIRSRASAGCAGAHELGQTAQTSLRYRHRPLPELRRQLKDHRRHRRSAGDCQNPYSSGPADPRPAARPGAASRFIPDNLRAENRLPTQADGAARSEFERAARSSSKMLVSSSSQSISAHEDPPKRLQFSP